MRDGDTRRDASATELLRVMDAGAETPAARPDAEPVSPPAGNVSEAAPAAGDQTAIGTEPDAPSATPRQRLDVLQLLFWVSIIVAVAAATVSITWPSAVGQSGSVLLITLACAGMVVLMWLARGAGRRLGLFPERGAAETAIAQQAAKPRYPWIESLSEAVLITERGGAPVTCNSAFHQLAGVAAGLGESHGPVTVDRLFGGSPGLAAPLYRLAKAAKSAQMRAEILPAVALGRDGRPAQFEASVSPLNAGKAMWRLRDVTGLELEGGVSTDPKALYIEDAPVGFFVSRPDGSILYMNSWLRSQLGLPEDVAPKRLDDIMHAASVRMLKRERRGDNTAKAQLVLIARDGVEIKVRAVTTWVGRGLDATGRTILTQAGSDILDGETRLTARSVSRPERADESDPMFDDAPFGVIRLSGTTVEDAVIQDANPAMMQLSSGRALPGVAFADLFTAEDGEDVLAAKLVDGITHAVALRLAGEPPADVNVRIALDSTGAPHIAYLMDMTEQKQLEMRLAQGEKMQAIGQLAGGLAHDFNNMLTGIILATDKLMIRHPVGDPSYSELKDIHEWSARAAELIRMLKAYARQETFKREIIDITEWLSEFSLLLRQLVDERVQLDLNHGRDLPKVKMDKSQLETSLINLATNARDAMLENGGGTLTIRTMAADTDAAHKLGFSYVEGGDYIVIEVADTGSGIANEHLEKIFEPFFTTKERGRGTGLGLATVYGIIKQSGGYVCPKSEVGKGTSFYLFLPALTEEEAAVPAPEPKPERKRTGGDISGRGRILLVEDEDGVRGIAAQLLKSCGYEVEEAADGETALEIIEANPGGFDLMISDVVLPNIDGPSLLKKARDKLGNARVMFISGYAEREVAKSLDEAASVSFLPKPFTLKQLAERVKQELFGEEDAAA